MVRDEIGMNFKQINSFLFNEKEKKINTWLFLSNHLVVERNSLNLIVFVLIKVQRDFLVDLDLIHFDQHIHILLHPTGFAFERKRNC